MGHEAFLFVDADCQIDSSALRVFNRHLADGKMILQANDSSCNPDQSAMSYAVSVGNVLENDLFYAPKSNMSMAVFLRGTGMVFRRDILLSHPWKAHSISEDVEYSLDLLREGIRIFFVSDVKVKSKYPAYKAQLKTQRRRWAGGTLKFAVTHALGLIWEGLIKKNILLSDAGWTLLVLSRPLVLLELFFSLILTIICVLVYPSLLSSWLLILSLIVVSLQALYFSLGIAFLGINLRRLRLLLCTPIAVLKLLAVTLSTLGGLNRQRWVRTPR
jgi:cellulose synthase/poly-beta-1,6-N-acetylglucosamine synthase-like glycosyltransferase